jgi:hypothetical protein
LCDRARVALVPGAKIYEPLVLLFWSFFWSRVFVCRLQHASGKEQFSAIKKSTRKCPDVQCNGLSGRMLRSPYQWRINVPNTHLRPS